MRAASSRTTQGQHLVNMTKRFFAGLLTPLLLTPVGICSPPQPNFSGTWKQSDERCVPKRTGDVLRRIDLRGPDLIVETTILRASGPPRHAVQRYRVDGTTSVSTGADGDEFHTSVVLKNGSLAFSVEEHEDGRILHSKETWVLSANASELQVQRESLDRSGDAGRIQTLIYTRQAPEVTDR